MSVASFIRSCVEHGGVAPTMLFVKIDEKVTRTGNITGVYASVKLDNAHPEEIDALQALYNLGNVAVRVRIPSNVSADTLVKTQVRPVMSARACAIVFAKQSGRLDELSEAIGEEFTDAYSVNVPAKA